jgi:CheY-like chemotaxis protein
MKAILFVDDHEVLARLSCEILEMQGFRAVSAYSAQDALDKFKHGPVDVGADAKTCLPKEEMFPALIEKIKIYLGDADQGARSLKSA